MMKTAADVSKEQTLLVYRRSGSEGVELKRAPSAFESSVTDLSEHLVC